ncbi:MAG: DUF4328 domain-containing protein [Actinomycetes bacterium]
MRNRSAAVISSAKFLLLVIWLTAFSSISSAQDYQAQLDARTDPKNISTLFGNLSFLASFAMGAAWVLTGPWLRDAHDRISATHPGQIRQGRAWAVWGWIVPVVSLWFPRQMIGDMLKDKRVDDEGDAIPLNSWWLSWIAFALLSNVQSAMEITNTTIHNPIRPTFEIAGACLLTAAYMVWIRIVKAIDAAS